MKICAHYGKNATSRARREVLCGETRFSPDKAYPEKFGAEAPEQPQNTARVKKVGFSPSALAPVAGAKLGMQIRSEFNLNSPNSLRIRSQREFAANSA